MTTGVSYHIHVYGARRVWAPEGQHFANINKGA